MNKVLLPFLLASFLTLPIATHAQAPERVDYTEQVVVEGAGHDALYARALDWTQHKFNYTPTTGLVSDPSKSTIRVMGSGTLKPVDDRGKDQNMTVLFTFRFQANDNGYTYHVSSFEVVPDPKLPTQMVPLDQYQTELQASRNNAKTHNDRRLGAQANSLASEVAMSFRSFMNSQPAEDHVGVGGEQHSAQ
ncbi:DUF4468 domain-containing protein [Hymenobacter psychrophilus]|uniref:DUF4468 domain-containing protein n=1 Tax=Hymenobacter psychrophilus TaxID=651662 RepID=A0A1H3JVT4_9BACT|nr:DUF4468 domain-containing protein [Hymenobacter psychrophilus]SDY44062.1 protein of unknown function [Hymenobacter psychrophilus]